MQSISTDQLGSVHGGQALDPRTQLLEAEIRKPYANDSIHLVEIGTPMFSGTKATVTVRTRPFWWGSWDNYTCKANVYQDDQGGLSGVYNLSCTKDR